MAHYRGISGQLLNWSTIFIPGIGVFIVTWKCETTTLGEDLVRSSNYQCQLFYNRHTCINVNHFMRIKRLKDSWRRKANLMKSMGCFLFSTRRRTSNSLARTRRYSRCNYFFLRMKNESRNSLVDRICHVVRVFQPQFFHEFITRVNHLFREIWFVDYKWSFFLYFILCQQNDNSSFCENDWKLWPRSIALNICTNLRILNRY